MSTRISTKIDLEIVTPEELLFSGTVDKVTVPGQDGALGILPGHAPMLSELGIGTLSFQINDRESLFYCSYGFVEVLGSRVSVLAEVAARTDQIDAKQAEMDRKNAYTQLKSTRPGTDYKAASELLHQAQARLETVSH